MRLEKGWAEKEYRIRIDLHEAIILYKFGAKKEEQNETIRGLSDAMYQFGYHSNGVDEKQVYDFVMTKEEGVRLLEEMENVETLQTIMEKIKTEIGGFGCE